MRDCASAYARTCACAHDSLSWACVGTRASGPAYSNVRPCMRAAWHTRCMPLARMEKSDLEADAQADFGEDSPLVDGYHQRCCAHTRAPLLGHLAKAGASWRGSRCQPSPSLSPTDPVPRGLLTLCPLASSGPQGLYTAYLQPIYSLYAACIQPRERKSEEERERREQTGDAVGDSAQEQRSSLSPVRLCKLQLSTSSQRCQGLSLPPPVQPL